MDAALLRRAIDAIDRVNAEDPNAEVIDGQPQPAAFLYGQRMTEWLEKLRPDAPDALRLAVRAQHIRRWDVPRDTFPMDRKGYLMWRRHLYKHHAETAGKILLDAGVDAETVGRAKFLIEKRQLNKDPDTQTLEDCACLVFLQHHFAAFAPNQDTGKMVAILQKTWAKMSRQAHGFALTLDYSPEQLALIKEALGQQ